MYLCLDPVTPFHESKVEIGDDFTLMYYKYSSKNIINARLLEGLPTERYDNLKEAGLTESGLNNYKIMADFIKTELIRDVGVGTEYLYDISNILRDYFDPDNQEQAYLYSSVKNYSRRNLALKPNIAKKLLICTGGHYGKLSSYSMNDESVTFYLLGSCNNVIYSDANIKFDDRGGSSTVTVKMNN